MGYIEPPTPGFYIINNTLYLLLFPPMTPMRGVMRRRSPQKGTIKLRVLETFPDGGLMRVLWWGVY